ARAMKVLSDREGAPPLGLLKTTLLQLDSTFDERSYGAGSFRDFAQKLEKAGVLKVTQGRGGWVVSPAEGAHASAETASADNGGVHAESAAGDQGIASHAPMATIAPHPSAPVALVEVVGTQADGLREFAR